MEERKKDEGKKYKHLSMLLLLLLIICLCVGGWLFYNSWLDDQNKLVVEMIRKDTSETIYQTGAMDPGNYLEQDRLDVDLPKGDYPVSIHFRNYDRKSEQFVGEAVTENVVHILN